MILQLFPQLFFSAVLCDSWFRRWVRCIKPSFRGLIHSFFLLRTVEYRCVECVALLPFLVISLLSTLQSSFHLHANMSHVKNFSNAIYTVPSEDHVKHTARKQEYTDVFCLLQKASSFWMLEICETFKKSYLTWWKAPSFDDCGKTMRLLESTLIGQS